jgi:hypothetical protein
VLRVTSLGPTPEPVRGLTPTLPRS